MRNRALGVWAAAVAISAAVAVVYGQVLGFDFVNFDDQEYVSENEMVARGIDAESLRWASTANVVNNWHPLTLLSFMLGVELYGLDPAGHHATNVVLHLANALILLGLLRSATGRVGPSALVAALFALHPLHVESVAWVSARKDLLSTAFGLLAMWTYLSYARRGGAARYGLVALLFGLSLMSKPMLVTLPFVLLLLDYWPLCRLLPPEGRGGARGPGMLGVLAEKVPLLALSCAVSVVTLWAQTGGEMMDEAPGLVASLGNAIVAYTQYFWKTLWPTGLSILYPHPAMPEWGGVPLGALQVAVSLAALLSISAAVAWARRRALVVGWLWYLGTLVPVIGLVQVGRQAMADRYTYVPLIGIFLMLAFGGAELVDRWRRRWPASGRAAAAVAMAWLACLAAVSHAQTGVWRDSASLYRHALASTPRNPMVHYNLGHFLHTQGDLEAAMRHYRLALRVHPRYLEAHINLGIALEGLGRGEEAMRHYRLVSRIDPFHADAHHNLGNALSRAGRLEEAAAAYRQALFAQADHREARRGLERTLRLLEDDPLDGAGSLLPSP